MGSKTMTEYFVDIEGVEYSSNDLNTIPSERVFREAWEIGDADANAVTVNLEKAKDIWRELIRRARVEPLKALDAAYMKALETGADTSQIVADKQALRDAPTDPAIDAATTTEELKLVQPAGLTVEF